jgi:hypothetical protein
VSGRYSAFALLKQGFTGHKGWPRAWRKAKPKPAYDFVIIGGGGHGLARPAAPLTFLASPRGALSTRLRAPELSIRLMRLD